MVVIPRFDRFAVVRDCMRCSIAAYCCWGCDAVRYQPHPAPTTLPSPPFQPTHLHLHASSIQLLPPQLCLLSLPLRSSSLQHYPTQPCNPVSSLSNPSPLSNPPTLSNPLQPSNPLPSPTLQPSNPPEGGGLEIQGWRGGSPTLAILFVIGSVPL